MPPVRRNVLMFHQGALGDFIVTWPLALALGRVYPQSRVVYVTAEQKGQLAERLLRVESTDAEGGWHELFSESPNLPASAEKVLKSAHTIVTFSGRDAIDPLFKQNIAAIAPEAELLCLQTRQADASPRHVAEFIIDQLTALPALQSAATQMLKWTNEQGLSNARPSSGNGQAVVIHPGSGAPRKCWPADRFVALARLLNSSGKTVRFVIGEVEREQWPTDRMEALHRVARVEQPTTYLELCDLVSRADAFVGNDSGPAHLAGIIGIPTVAIFGGDPTRWHPIGPRVRIVRRDTIDAISLDDVLGAMP